VCCLQVPTLVDAVETPGRAGPKAPGNINSTSSKASGSGSSSKPAPQATAAAGPGTGVLVVTESAAGYNLCCPAGQYRLNLTHPAVRHMLGQLLELRSRLQQLQQQVKQQQLEQQQPQPTKGAAAVSSGSSVKAAGKRSSSDVTPGDSRSTSPVPSGGVTPQGEKFEPRYDVILQPSM
jgi:TolA-binding protein